MSETENQVQSYYFFRFAPNQRLSICFNTSLHIADFYKPSLTQDLLICLATSIFALPTLTS